MNYWSLSFLILLFACNLNSDASTAPEYAITESTTQNLPTRRQLFRKQYEMQEIHVITPEGNSSYAPLWESMKGEVGRGMSTKYSTVDNWDRTSLASKVVFLVGSVKNHELIQELYDQLPFIFNEQKLIFADKTFDDPSTIFRISLFPNPLNPDIPMYLLTGNSDEQIINFIKEQYDYSWRRYIRSSFGYQIFEKDKCQMTGFFSEETWKVDKKLHWDFSGKKSKNYKTPHFEFVDHRQLEDQILSTKDLEKIGKACEANCKVISEYFGKPISEQVQYHIYEDMERKGLMTYNTHQSHLDLGKKEIHVTHSDAFLDNNLQLENQFFINEILGKAAHPWMANGTSIYFAKKWQRYGFKYWAKKLLQSDNLPPVKDLIEEELVNFESPIVLGAGQAALVDYLLTNWGKEKFAEQYKNWNPTEAEIKNIQSGVEKLILSYETVETPKRKRSQDYLKGFNFAHEGYQIYNGYGSSLAQKSLEKMASLGSNAMALVPYSGMRDPNKPTRMSIADNAGSENGASLIHSIQHAKLLGMTTVMKPQVWLGRSWTGFVEMKSPEDWDLFFEHYYRWIRHFALISEIYEVDVFSVVVEFVQATLQNEEAWKKMFEKLRPLFSGEMTYCANWGDEFEQLNFWESLDFIGINCYYPLSKNDNPSQKELDQNFAKITEKIEAISKQFDKKIVFTEIGFRSVDGTWKNPHAYAEDRAFNEQAQAMSYEAVFKNIADKPWCDGILWWKWPSYLEYSPAVNTRFTPLDKTTETVIKKWFNRN